MDFGGSPSGLDLVLAIVLGAISVAVIGYILFLVLAALDWQPATQFERWRFMRFARRIRAGDHALESGQVEAALRAFRAAFYPHAARSRAMAEEINRHHTALLSRLIAAADELQGGTVRLLALAKVDRLFHERRDLQRALLTIDGSRHRERLENVRAEFAANTEQLRAAFEALNIEILSSRPQKRYH